MSVDNWMDKYLPIINKRNDGYGISVNEKFYLYETYGKDLEEIIETNKERPQHIWTLITDDEGDELIVEGYHYINRVGYFVTEQPCQPDATYLINYN